MTASTEFTIGSEVVCSDGVCGEIRRVVVDPVARALTHLVVEPRSQHGTGRLVPIDLAEATGTEVRLRCTLAEFHALEEAEETHFIDGGGQMDYEQGQALSLPLFTLGAGTGGLGGMGMGGLGMGGLGMGGLGMGMGGLGMRGMGSMGYMAPPTTTEDRVPDGDVEVRRGEHVHATDGEIGRIHGFVIDPADHGLTHIILDEGHLWGKKTVAIPISAIRDINDGVRLSITKEEVGNLPSVDLNDHQ
jgi:hypothetical protein